MPKKKKGLLEKHLSGPTVCHPNRKGLENVSEKIDELIKMGVVESVKIRGVEYLKFI